MRGAKLGCVMGIGGWGGNRKYPNRGRIDNLATELRGIELEEAEMSSANLKSDPSHRVREMGIAIHGATHLNRDPDFRSVGLFMVPGLKYDP